MEKTLQEYAAKIQKGEVDPIVYYNRSKSGVIFNPQDEKVPRHKISPLTMDIISCISNGLWIHM